MKSPITHADERYVRKNNYTSNQCIKRGWEIFQITEITKQFSDCLNRKQKYIFILSNIEAME